MDGLIDGYWLPIGRFCVAAGIDYEQARRAAQRGMLEATFDERGRMLIAAKDVVKVRRDLAEEAERKQRAALLAGAKFEGKSQEDAEQERQRLIDGRVL